LEDDVFVGDLDTPALLVDLDVMEANLARLGSYCRTHNLKLRPHTKTHKIPEIAKMQLESGATGIAVAKVSEAEVMAGAGIRDIMIAYPIATPAKAKRLAALAEQAQISVSLDSADAARVLSQQASERGTNFNLLVEIDVGFHRCGVRDAHDAVALARTIVGLRNVNLGGIMFYPGHLLAKPEQQTALLGPVNDVLDKALAAFADAGLPVQVVSGGSTPTAYRSHEFHGVTEIRPGMYLFNDRNMMGADVAALTDCAVSVAVTVVSTAVSGRAIVDGGSKTFSSDRFLSGDGVGCGLVREDPEAAFESMSEEHGHLNISKSSKQYRVGDRLTIVPNHVCTTINMHHEVYGIRGETVESVWQVAGQGKIR
jgi:D-serine deaminase-like pyridoxal phosphate-dependent protein